MNRKNNGYAKLQRSYLDIDEVSKDPYAAALYAYCTARANFKNCTYKGAKVEKGSFLTSMKKLADENGMDKNTVRKRLKKLQDYNLIHVKSDKHGTKITVIRHDENIIDKNNLGEEVTHPTQSLGEEVTHPTQSLGEEVIHKVGEEVTPNNNDIKKKDIKKKYIDSPDLNDRIERGLNNLL